MDRRPLFSHSRFLGDGSSVMMERGGEQQERGEVSPQRWAEGREDGGGQRRSGLIRGFGGERPGEGSAGGRGKVWRAEGEKVGAKCHSHSRAAASRSAYPVLLRGVPNQGGEG